jgi:hypothetical protein
MAKRQPKSRSLGRGYRARIRALAAMGATEAAILKAIPGLRPSELKLTLSIAARRGRPPKGPTVRSLADVKRWRSTKRPRTLRAAVECIDFLLELVEQKQRVGSLAQFEPAKRGKTLPGFS